MRVAIDRHRVVALWYRSPCEATVGEVDGDALVPGTRPSGRLRVTFPGLLVLIVLTPVAKGDHRATMAVFGVLLSPGVYRLVRQSGSGKTQTAFAVLGVLPSKAVVTRGSIRLDGRELLGLSERELRAVRGTSIAYVPQEPMSNLACCS